MVVARTDATSRSEFIAKLLEKKTMVADEDAGLWNLARFCAGLVCGLWVLRALPRRAWHTVIAQRSGQAHILSSVGWRDLSMGVWVVSRGFV